MYKSIYRINMEQQNTFIYNSEDFWDGVKKDANYLGRGGKDNKRGKLEARHNVKIDKAANIRKSAMLDLDDWYDEEVARLKSGKSKYKNKAEIDKAYDEKEAAINNNYKTSVSTADSERDKDLKNVSTGDNIKYYAGKAFNTATLGTAVSLGSLGTGLIGSTVSGSTGMMLGDGLLKS